jgi:hypothetical protein
MLSLELKKGADPRRWGLASILLYYEPAKEFLLLLFLLDGKIILSQTTLMNICLSFSTDILASSLTILSVYDLYSC